VARLGTIVTGDEEMSLGRQNPAILFRMLNAKRLNSKLKTQNSILTTHNSKLKTEQERPTVRFFRQH
jgi:hypothetical protein